MISTTTSRNIVVTTRAISPHLSATSAHPSLSLARASSTRPSLQPPLHRQPLFFLCNHVQYITAASSLPLTQNQLHTTSSRILITVLSHNSILLHLPHLRKPNNSSLLDTRHNTPVHMSNPNLYALNQITTRYNTAQRSHLRTQQFIL